MSQFHKRQTPEAPDGRNDSGPPEGRSRRSLHGTEKNHSQADIYLIQPGGINKKMQYELQRRREFAERE